jgi:hypothetical protein
MANARAGAANPSRRIIDCGGGQCGDKASATAQSDRKHIAISAMLSTGVAASAKSAAWPIARIGARRMIAMKKVNSLLRLTSSRLRRQLAVIVEIAAASLPSAGA